jgi:hypothetical protein
VFIHSNVRTEAKKEKSRSRMTDKAAKNTQARIETIRNKTITHTLPEQDCTSKKSTSFLSVPKSSRNLISTSLRQQLLASYVSQYHITSPGEAPDGCTWITAIPLIAAPIKALETSAYALSLARLSASMNNPDMIQESLNLYTQGLRHLQKALWDPKLMCHDETLAACVLLSMYEVFRCPNNSGAAYSAHHNGCARLIQLRGPMAHIDGLGHSIFQWFRYVGVSASSLFHNSILMILDSSLDGNKINFSL